MAASSKIEKTGQDEVDEMFGQAAGSDDFADIDDLLDSVEEDDSEGWVPTEVGEGIAGIVVGLSQTRSDFATKEEDAMCPTVTVETKDGTKWRVIGYGAVLKRELQEKDPQVGDKIAIKYFGERLMKKGKFAGKPYKHFGVVVRRKVSA